MSQDIQYSLDIERIKMHKLTIFMIFLSFLLILGCDVEEGDCVPQPDKDNMNFHYLNISPCKDGAMQCYLEPEEVLNTNESYLKSEFNTGYSLILKSSVRVDVRK